MRPDQHRCRVMKWGGRAGRWAKAEDKGGKVHCPQVAATAKFYGKEFGYRERERESEPIIQFTGQILHYHILSKIFKNKT